MAPSAEALIVVRSGASTPVGTWRKIGLVLEVVMTMAAAHTLAGGDRGMRRRVSTYVLLEETRAYQSRVLSFQRNTSGPPASPHSSSMQRKALRSILQPFHPISRRMAAANEAIVRRVLFHYTTRVQITGFALRRVRHLQTLGNYIAAVF